MGRSEPERGCTYYERLFSPYIHGGLDSNQRVELADHLRDCERCSEQFGAAWKVATAATAGEITDAARYYPRPISPLILWVALVLGCLGVAIFSWSDFTPRPDPLRSIATDERVTRLLEVQTDLLDSMVDPLRGVEHRVTAEVKSEVVGFFQSLRKAKQLSNATGTGFADHLHEFFRACDPAVGGRVWSREEFMLDLAGGALPAVTLVSVINASRRFVLCRVTWGQRPAFAILTRGRKPSPEIFDASAPLRLTYLLMSRP